MRPDDRAIDELRPISFERDFTDMADGSVMVRFGRTHVLCTASIEEDVPRWMRGTGKGWVTAEYSMLPGSSPERIRRRVSGRDQEIQRLIGRSLRAVCDMKALGERQITVDCDVLQADGGTRTACHLRRLRGPARRAVPVGGQGGTGQANPLSDNCAAVSVGIIDEECRLDLPYIEDADGGGGHERGDEREWRLHRGAGHGGRRGVRAGPPEHPSGSGFGRHRSDRRAAESADGRGASRPRYNHEA